MATRHVHLWSDKCSFSHTAICQSESQSVLLTLKWLVDMHHKARWVLPRNLLIGRLPQPKHIQSSEDSGHWHKIKLFVRRMCPMDMRHSPGWSRIWSRCWIIKRRPLPWTGNMGRMHWRSAPWRHQLVIYIWEAILHKYIRLPLCWLLFNSWYTLYNI